MSEKEIKESGEKEIDLEKIFKKLLKDKNSLSAVSISCLLKVIEHSNAQTIHGLRLELIEAEKKLLKISLNNCGKYTSSISLISGCELFIRSVTRQSYKEIEFGKFKKNFLERGQKIAKLSVQAKNKIANLFDPFLQDSVTILLIGYSSVALDTLLKYKKRRFSVIIPEGRPDGVGYRSANELAKHGIPTTVITDNAVGHLIHKIDFVLCGAEGVLENGGIINKIGTYQIAILAKAFNIPFYCCVESFKFVRKYFLHQKDTKQIKFVTKQVYTPLEIPGEKLDERVKIDNPISDFTPPKFITFLITDLGIMTPSGISDELIKLYS